MKRMFSKLNIILLIIGMIFLYKDVLYYQIPKNPIEKLYNEQPEIFRSYYIIKYENLEITHTEDYKSEIHMDILKYFANLKMLPIKDYDRDYHKYLLGLNFVQFNIGKPHHQNLYIKFWGDNVIEIQSKEIVKDGFYKVIGEPVDFIYLCNTLKDNKLW